MEPVSTRSGLARGGRGLSDGLSQAPRRVDYLVVGSGLTGSVVARCLVDAGREVLVVERRSHVGGNVHDSLHDSGIRIHTYGPHYFRTSSPRIWAFAQRFGEFYPVAASVKSWVGGNLENWPVTREYLERHFGAWKPSHAGGCRNFEEAALAKMPRQAYELFVRGYTEKQWGVPARSLSMQLASRFGLGREADPRLSSHRFQGLPLDGYHAWMEQLLAGIPRLVGYDYLKERGAIEARRKLIFTGPIDEWFGYELGRLGYRGQRRQTVFHPDIQWVQPVVQVNYPDPLSGPQIRSLEWKHLMPPGEYRGTLITQEVPFTPDEPDHYEYPFPDQANQRLYRRYRQAAEQLPDIWFCGRLGEYRYYDMDQAIGRALKLAQRLLSEQP